ncbi:MAG: TetR family transcriptional regulator [Actinobacteria bacterium]|nr:TetR family transcriptional regulator [Actinomycetota bacterium]
MAFTETQEQILDAAMQIIVRDGLEETSMRAVAEEAEVSLGLLSYHFEGKENLIVSAFRRAADRLMEITRELLDAAGDDPRARIQAGLRPFFDDELSDVGHLEIWLAMWAVARTNDDVALAEQDLYERHAEVLRDAIRSADESLPEDIVRQRTTDVIALQNGLWLNWTRWGNPESLERGLARCESIALGS